MDGIFLHFRGILQSCFRSAPNGPASRVPTSSSSAPTRASASARTVRPRWRSRIWPRFARSRAATSLYPSDAVSAAKLVALMAQRSRHLLLTHFAPRHPPCSVMMQMRPSKSVGQKYSGQNRTGQADRRRRRHHGFRSPQGSREVRGIGNPLYRRDRRPTSIKPFAHELVWKASQATRNPGLILTVEDHYLEGGLGDTVAGELSSNGARVHKLAACANCPAPGSKDELLARYGIDSQAILTRVRALIEGGREGERGLGASVRPDPVYNSMVII